jgi:hypothetical protein
VASGTATAAVIEAAPHRWKARAAAVAAAANVEGWALVRCSRGCWFSTRPSH